MIVKRFHRQILWAVVSVGRSLVTVQIRTKNVKVWPKSPDWHVVTASECIRTAPRELSLFGMPVNHMVCGILEPIFADRINVNFDSVNLGLMG
jgi:hypothetical protein